MVFTSVLNKGIATHLCYHSANKTLLCVAFDFWACLSAHLGTFPAYILTGSPSPYLTIIPLPIATPSCLLVYSGIFNPVPNVQAPHVMHKRSVRERLAENEQLSGKPCKLVRREMVEKCKREGGIPVPGLWGWLKGQDECHISVFTSCPKATKSAGAVHRGQIKYLSSPCCVVKNISVSCSFFAPCIHLPVLPVLIRVASFLPLLPVATCLMAGCKCIWYPWGMSTGPGAAGEIRVPSDEPGSFAKTAWSSVSRDTWESCGSCSLNGFQLLSVRNLGARGLDLGVLEAEQQVSDTQKCQWRVLGRHQNLDIRSHIDSICTQQNEAREQALASSLIPGSVWPRPTITYNRSEEGCSLAHSQRQGLGPHYCLV